MTPHVVHPDAVKGVRLFLMDVDGVLTDGRLWFGTGGFAMKAFHVRDGMGIANLHRAGVLTGIVSGRDDPGARHRAEELGMAVIVTGESRKGNAVERILSERGLTADRVAFLGDDVNDLPAMMKVGLPLAVADAHPEVRSFVRYVTRARGGAGAVREVADAILGVESAFDEEGA
ncbi:MAG: KdsC family phosphatase [Planctomycetota bacterium JB042]